jgi:homoserine dehydrogenase
MFMVQDAGEVSSFITDAVASMRPAEPLLVLKFGSSVLRTVAVLPRVAGEIYRQRRRGFAVVAVVSALEGETDRLFAEAASVADGTACAGVADLVSLGEARTAALLRIACDRIGMRAVNCQPEALGLATAGGETGSRPLALDPVSLRAKLARTGLVIVPGFVGIGAGGQRTLLERGGSDFSAIYLGELGAAAVRLYKDADGVFEADPARDPSARRYDEISWDDALQVARPLIQPQAVEYAAARRLPIEIEAIGSDRVSRVGPVTSVPRADVAGPPVRVALAGYGVVGQAVARRLAQEPRFKVVSVLVRDENKPRDVPSPVPVTTNPAQIALQSPDILVDALSCERLGAVLCGEQLRAGGHVASASKRVVSDAGAALAAGAQGGAVLAYSAAVGGGVTMLESIARVRADGASIVRAWGVLNGTVNAILTGMSRGQDFDAALRRAQAAGFAEEDPRADLSGADAAAKLQIIARAAFSGAEPEIDVEALDDAAAARIAASGERWVQLAELESAGGHVVGRVRLAPMSLLGGADLPEDEWNCLHLELADGGRMSCTGRGAGGAATAEAIVADLYDLAALARPVAAPLSIPLTVTC